MNNPPKVVSLPGNALKDVRVLVVDDEEILAWSIDTELRALGADVMRAGSVREALERFQAQTPDVAITDLRLPDGNGLELLKKWRLEWPDMPVILITAHGAIDSAITALRLGAYDYLQKPFNIKDLIVSVRRSAETAKLRQRLSAMQAAEATAPEVEIIGDTPSMRRLKDQLEKIAHSKANTALVLGDSGTGKELAARAIHVWSERRSQPFVEINCASIPETLLESELFGYEKGAFTDARERKLGLFEIARSGSIFLDEIGEMPLKLQAKLLRALESRRFKRLGGTKDVEFHGRIIAATNRRLVDEVAGGRFRADLYFRLNVLPVSLPLLRERLDDIPKLALYLLDRLAIELGLSAPKLSEGAISYLKTHSWPGNVRELRNVLQRAMVYFEPQVIEPHHLEFDAWPSQLASPPRQAASSIPMAPALPTDGAGAASAPRPAYPVGLAENDPLTEGIPAGFTLPPDGISLETVEKSLLLQALQKARNNQTRAAELLGISRHTLRYRLEKYGLELPN